jgi:type II secretory ATPase GspE/PulE/Tfp pilus assembly ATPase PilB-like protein
VPASRSPVASGRSFASALVRLRELGLPPTSLGTAVHALLSERLLRRPCAHCAAGVELAAEETARVGLPAGIRLYRPRGCVHCRYSGEAGHVAVSAALTVNAAVRGAIDRTAAEIEERAVESGATPIRERARSLYASGRTTVDELLRVLGEPS